MKLFALPFLALFVGCSPRAAPSEAPNSPASSGTATTVPDAKPNDPTIIAPEPGDLGFALSYSRNAGSEVHMTKPVPPLLVVDRAGNAALRSRGGKVVTVTLTMEQSDRLAQLLNARPRLDSINWTAVSNSTAGSLQDGPTTSITVTVDGEKKTAWVYGFSVTGEKAMSNSGFARFSKVVRGLEKLRAELLASTEATK